jgi:Sporulation related domain.
MKNNNNFIWVVVLLICMNSNHAMSNRPKDKEDMSDKKSFSVAINEKGSGEAPATFLDTLNRGKEFSLNDRDFVPITTESTSVAGQKDVKEDAAAEGYRIQCFASSQIEKVRSEQKQLGLKVKYPLYIVYNAPYYKLLVGDFIKRNDADNALAKLREMGYGDSWVARSKIETKH